MTHASAGGAAFATGTPATRRSPERVEEKPGGVPNATIAGVTPMRDGKEGVDGSSPSEGFDFLPA
jgi:hypothetical protein